MSTENKLNSACVNFQLTVSFFQLLSATSSKFSDKESSNDGEENDDDVPNDVLASVAHRTQWCHDNPVAKRHIYWRILGNKWQVQILIGKFIDPCSDVQMQDLVETKFIIHLLCGFYVKYCRNLNSFKRPQNYHCFK